MEIALKIIEKTLGNIKKVFTGPNKIFKITGIIFLHMIPVAYLKKNGVIELSIFLILFNYFSMLGLLQVITKNFVNKIKNIKLINVFKSSNKNYKEVEEILNNKVKVIEVTKDLVKLNSFITSKDIQKKKEDLELFFNREIESIKRNDKNLRIVDIYFKDNYKEKILKYKDKYFLEEYLSKTRVDKAYKIPVFLGVRKTGEIIIHDLVRLCHTFISGQTGSGKSTLLNCMIQSIMFFCNYVSFIMVDFKKVELGIYKDFNNTYRVFNHNDFLEKVIWLKEEMEKRYTLFDSLGIKDIESYNKSNNKKMCYIVFIIDEISCIKLNSKRSNNEDNVEDILIEILNMSRAAGIFVIACTQNPHGFEIKANLRNKFVTNISGRMKRKKDQEKTNVFGTENLQDGEFKYNTTDSLSEIDEEFKSFFVKDKFDKLFLELEKVYGGKKNGKKNGNINLKKE